MSDRPFLPTDIPAMRGRAALDLAHVAKWLVAGGPDGNPAAIAAAGRASDRVQRLVKAAVAGGKLSDDDTWAATATGWIESLRSVGVFDAMLSGMINVDMHVRFGVSTTSYVGDEVQEGMAKPVARLSIAGTEPLRPRKVAGIMVITRELSRFSGASDLINRELQGGIVAGVDSIFLNELLALAGASSSSGSSVEDIDSLLAQLPLGARSRPYFVLHNDLMKTLSTERSGNIRLFPELGVQGGSINGITALSTDQVPSGTMMLIDAAGIAAAEGEVQLAASSAADVLMDNAPSMSIGTGSPTAPVPAQLVSMFQVNAVALRAERSWSYKLLRDDAVAAVTGAGSP